eukprot:1278691-Rhodomonas_salina.2
MAITLIAATTATIFNKENDRTIRGNHGTGGYEFLCIGVPTRGIRELPRGPGTLLVVLVVLASSRRNHRELVVVPEHHDNSGCQAEIPTMTTSTTASSSTGGTMYPGGNSCSNDLFYTVPVTAAPHFSY